MSKLFKVNFIYNGKFKSHSHHIRTLKTFTYDNRKSAVLCLLTLKSSHEIASTSFEPEILIHSLPSLSIAHTLYGQRYGTFSLIESPQNYLYSGSFKDIFIFSLLSHEKVGIIPNAHDDWVTSLAYNESSSALISCSNDAKIKIWSNTLTSSPVLTHTLSSHISAVNCLLLAQPRQNKLISGSSDRTIRVYDTTKEYLLINKVTNKVSWNNSIIQYKINYIIVNSWGGEISIYEIETLQLFKRFDIANGPINCMCHLSPSAIALGLKFNSSALVVDIESGKVINGITIAADRNSYETKSLTVVEGKLLIGGSNTKLYSLDI